MDFHLLQTGTIARPEEIKKGMAGQKPEFFQRYLEEVAAYARLADRLGYAGYGHNEHHLNIEGFEVSNHPGMTSLYIGLHTERLQVDTLGYVLPTHNPVRVAEEIATLDHMLNGRLGVGFVRGYQARWVENYAAVQGAAATTPGLASKKDAVDDRNRQIFEESVEVVLKAWAETVFDHKGQVWQFPVRPDIPAHPVAKEFGAGVDENGFVAQIGIAPKPLQVPAPRVYGAFAHSMRTVRFWARNGGKPIVMANDLDFCAALWDAYANEAKAHDRDVAPDDIAAFGGLLCLAETDAEVERQRQIHMWMWETWLKPYGQQLPMMLIGTPDQVARLIEEALERVPFTECFLQIGQGYLDRGEVEAQIELFAEQVAPQFV